MKKILLIITGSIAAYKTVDFIRFLQKNNFIVTVILTKSASEFVTKTSILSMCNTKIYEEDVFFEPMLHIDLTKEHDLILVAPASANYIAKMANGMANSLSLCAILASKIPVFVAPAMNPTMYSHPATCENISKIRNFGYRVIDPAYGIVACKEEGFGKLASFEEILDKINPEKQKLKGKKVIVTYGSTREYIDPVRFLGNSSSGEQGILMADAFLDAGAEVIEISGYTTFCSRDSFKAYSAKEILEISEKHLPADIYISVAAISDFKAKNYSDKKIKKQNSNSIYNVELEKNIDVVSTIAHHHSRPMLVVGFALESENFEEYAQEKLDKKNLDIIICNKVPEMHQKSKDYIIYTKDSKIELLKCSKRDLALNLVNMMSDNNIFAKN